MFHVEQGRGRTPSVKACGFASSLGEGASGVPPTSVLALSVTCGASSPKGRASGETGDFAIYPITFPPCQGPHPRGGCLRSRLGEFRQIPPQALPCQLPQGDAFALCRKLYATAKSRPLGEGGCDQREQTEGVTSAQAHFALQPETFPPCQGLSLWESWRVAPERARMLKLNSTLGEFSSRFFHFPTLKS